jgi:cell division protein FtsX
MQKKLIPCSFYGIWNDCAKEFQFGIKTVKSEQALKGLEKKIGNNSKKWRFVAKSMNDVNLINLHNRTQIQKQENKIEQLKQSLEYEKQVLKDFINS